MYLLIILGIMYVVVVLGLCFLLMIFLDLFVVVVRSNSGYVKNLFFDQFRKKDGIWGLVSWKLRSLFYGIVEYRFICDGRFFFLLDGFRLGYLMD